MWIIELNFLFLVGHLNCFARRTCAQHWWQVPMTRTEDSSSCTLCQPMKFNLWQKVQQLRLKIVAKKSTNILRYNNSQTCCVGSYYQQKTYKSRCFCHMNQCQAAQVKFHRWHEGRRAVKKFLGHRSKNYVSKIVITFVDNIGISCTDGGFCWSSSGKCVAKLFCCRDAWSRMAGFESWFRGNPTWQNFMGTCNSNLYSCV